MATNLLSCFSIQFLEPTPEVSSKLYFVEICQVSEKLRLFNHKRAEFLLPNFEFKRSLLTLLKPGLHISREDRKHLFANMFLSYPDMAWTAYRWDDHKY